MLVTLGRMLTIPLLYFLSYGISVTTARSPAAQCLRELITQFSQNHNLFISFVSATKHSLNIYEQTEVIDSVLAEVQYHPRIIYTFHFNATLNWIDVHSSIGNYIIFISINTGYGIDLNVSLQKHLENLRNSETWNPGSYFFVIVLDYKSQKPNKIAKYVASYLWNWKIAHAVVFKYAYEKAAEENKAIKLYTWYLYKDNKKCENIRDILVMNTWITNGDSGYFIKNNSLFHKDLKPNTRGCPIRISTVPMWFFVVPSKYEYVQSSSSIMPIYTDGLEIKIIKAIAGKLNMVEKYLPRSEKPWILMDKRGNVLGYARDFYTKNADIAFGGMSLTYVMFLLSDPTNIYLWDKISWYVPCGSKFPRWESPVRIFSKSLWICFGTSIALSVTVVTLLANVSRSRETSSYKGVISTLCKCWGVIVGVCISLPKSLSVRMFFMSWICYSLIINTIFQSYLTTYLIDPGFIPHFRTLQELLNSSMSVGLVDYDLQLYINSNDEYISKIMKNVIDCTLKEDCLKWAIQYGNISIVQSTLYMDYVKADSSLHSTHQETNTLCLLEDEVVQHLRFVMIMPKGSPLFPVVNDIIVRLTEAGFVDHWINDYFYKQNIIHKKHVSHKLLDEYTKLTLAHMESPFYLMTLACGLSILVLFVEILYHRIKFKLGNFQTC